MALRVAATLCFALMAALIKLAVARGASPLETIFYRSAFGLVPVIGWVVAGPGLGSVRTPRWRAHATRTAIGLTGMFFVFEALARLPLAEATAIAFMAPLFATVLSGPMLGEKIGPHRWFAIAIGFAGMIVVTQPGGAGAPEPFALALAAIAAVFQSLVAITIRQIGATEPATTTVFWFTAVCTLATAPMLPWIARGHDAGTWAVLAGLGLAGGCAQLLMTASLRFAPVSTVAPLDYLQLLWAALLGWLLFATLPTAAVLGGGALIAAGGLYTFHREHRRRAAGVAQRTGPAI